jgi:hypothetical protein
MLGAFSSFSASILSFWPFWPRRVVRWRMQHLLRSIPAASTTKRSWLLHSSLGWCRPNWAQKRLAAAFIVGLRLAELRPKEGGRCCFHRRAEAGRIETKRSLLLNSSSGCPPRCRSEAGRIEPKRSLLLLSSSGWGRTNWDQKRVAAAAFISGLRLAELRPKEAVLRLSAALYVWGHRNRAKRSWLLLHSSSGWGRPN